MSRLLTFFLLASLLTSPIACGGNSETQIPPEPQVIFHASKGSVTLKVEVARSSEDRSRGLMGRTGLEPDRGMVFVWETPTESPFWMKNTLIPLSIAFIAADGAVIDIQDMEPLSPTRHFPAGPYMFAVEANKGFFEKNGVAKGDRATFAGL